MRFQFGVHVRAGIEPDRDREPPRATDARRFQDKDLVLAGVESASRAWRVEETPVWTVYLTLERLVTDASSPFSRQVGTARAASFLHARRESVASADGG